MAFILPCVLVLYRSYRGHSTRLCLQNGLCWHPCILHQRPCLGSSEAPSGLSTVFFVHGVLADVLKQPLDWTHPLAMVTHAVANIPMPALQPAPKQAAAKGTKAKQSAQSVSHSSTDVKKDR